MTKKQIKQGIKEILEEGYSQDQIVSEPEAGGDPYVAIFVGSVMSLDPCGRYHHILSPNGVTKKCERYWNNFEACCNELNCWYECGLNGDLCDVFICYIPENLDEIIIPEKEEC